MGYLRFLLALAVSVQHLWTNSVAGSVGVFGFYCISGFLVTKILCETYTNGVQGRLFFLLNRILRIYPTYLMCLAVGFGCIYFFDNAHSLKAALTIPSNIYEWSRQFFVLGLNPWNEVTYNVRILPPAWSLNTELIFYAIIFCIGKSRIAVALWSLISLAITVYLASNSYAFKYHYFTWYGPSICFAGGALLYHFIHIFSPRILLPSYVVIILAAGLCYVPTLFEFSLYKNRNVIFLYIAVPIFLYTIASIMQKGSSTPWERFIGDVSYPLFLLHWPIAAIFYPNFSAKTMDLWLASTALSLVISIIIVLLLNRFVENTRRKIRQKAKQGL